MPTISNRTLFVGALIATASVLGGGVSKYFSDKYQAERTRIQEFSRLKDSLTVSEHTIKERMGSAASQQAGLYKTVDVFVTPSSDPEKNPPKGHTTHAVIEGMVGTAVPVDIAPCTKSDMYAGTSCKSLQITAHEALAALEKVNDDALKAFRDGKSVTVISIPAAIVNALPAPEGLTIRPMEVVPSKSTTEEKVPDAKVLRRITGKIPGAPVNASGQTTPAP